MAQKTSSAIGSSYQYLPHFAGLGWEELLIHTPSEDNNCYLVALDNRQISVLLSLLDQVAWCWWLWGIAFGDETMGRVVNDFTDGLKDCLMSGCNVGDLVEVLSGIRESIDGVGSVIEGCCEGQERGGQKIDDPPHDGTVEIGPGEKFEDQEAYFNAKCSVANGIYDTVLGSVASLDMNYDSAVTVGGLTAIVAGVLVAAGPLGWAIAGLSLSIVSITFLVLSSTINFSDIQSALAEQHSDLVGVLYSASSGVVAKASFMEVLGDAATSLGTYETKLVAALVTNKLVNQLFNPRSDMIGYESPSPITCGSTLQVWPFTASGEGWTFRDDSTGSYSASGVWNSDEEAWRITLVGPGTGTGPRAEGRIFITGLSIAVDVGNSVQFDHGGSSDNVITGRNIKVIFSDLSEQYYAAVSTKTPGTAVLSIEAAKTISEIEIGLGRNWSNAFNATRDIEEVRVL